MNLKSLQDKTYILTPTRDLGVFSIFRSFVFLSFDLKVRQTKKTQFLETLFCFSFRRGANYLENKNIFPLDVTIPNDAYTNAERNAGAKHTHF